MHRRFFSLTLIISLSLGVALAQQAPVTPSVERLHADIEYLASDKLEGRRTGTPGSTLAAEYIAREFSRLGLRRSIGYDTAGMSVLEADSPNRYLQKFPYVVGVELGKNNRLVVEHHGAAAQLKVGEDWMPLGFSSSSDIQKAKYEFVGYGVTATEQKYDSYAGHSLKGTIAVALSSTPDGDNPHGQFARYEDVRWKAVAARNAGASALLVIAKVDNLKEDRLAQLRYDNSAGDAGLPVAVISRQLAASLFGSTGDWRETISDLEKQANAARTSTLTGATITSLPISGVAISFSINLVRREGAASNVVGILDGSDPTLKNEVIVVGAHYDHLGRGGEGSLAPREGEIHHGADDNASGTAAVLELARMFKAEGARPRRTILFMAFSGEEEGLLGSNYYVNHPILPLANMAAMLNMDMIGRMKENKLIIGGVGTATGFRDLMGRSNLEAASLEPSIAANPSRSPVELAEPYVLRRNEAAKPDDHTLIGNAINSGRLEIGRLLTKQAFQLTLNEDGFGPSDHSSFYAKQIPVLFFWTGTHDDYHKPSDTADKINYADEARVIGLVARIINDLDSSDKRPSYTLAKSDSTGRATGFRVYLGTIPNYADSNDGLLLDGVRENSPAATAGIKAGDKIVKLAGREIRNVYDYTYALGEMKAGQEYEVELLRAGQRIKLVITPAARK
jgi:Zn-dependent M28 family amino/carboxypeptidase